MPSTKQAHTSLEILLAAKPRSSAEIETLVRVGTFLNSTLDLRSVLQVAMEEAAKATGAEASAILLIDDETGDLVFEVATGDRGDQTKEVRLRSGEGVAGWVAEHGRPVRVDDAQDDPRFTSRVDEKTALVTRSILCVPLRVKDRKIGVLEVINKHLQQGFTENDEEFLLILSCLIAGAIDNAQLYRKVYEEKETLRAVLDSMADGVLVVDRNNRIILHNQAVLDLVGVSSQKLSLECLGDERILTPAKRLVSESKGHDSFQIDLRSGEESTTLANTSTLLRDPSGKVTGAVMVMRDITERARLEKMKNDFIATTSHKLRTPLTSILGFASLLRDGELRDSSGETGEDPVSSAASAIEEQGRYLRELIEKLLSFTGLELGNLKLQKETTQIGSLLDAACHMVRCRAETKAIRVDASVTPENLTAIVDRQRILHVLINLVENAVKFSPDGTTVSVTVELAGGITRVSVSDQGPGIPEEEQDRIFEKFYQIDHDLTGQVEGAGLGLALCKNIVTAHGGRIEIESSPGRGSTFRIHLPITTDESS